MKNKINDVVALSNLLARKTNNLKDIELKKLFFIALASVPDFHEKLGNDTIIINKKEMFDRLGIDEQKGDTYKRYRSLFQKLIRSTYYDFGNDKEFESGYMFYDVSARGNSYKIKVNKKFLPALAELKKNYTKFLTDDLMQFKSAHSASLYQFLMSMSNRKEVDFTTKQLKETFGLSKDDYCYKNGKFDRKNFEIKTIETALEEIDAKCKSIVIFKQLNEKGQTQLYRKTYKKNKDGKETRFVDRYIIRFQVTDPHIVLNQQTQIQTTINEFLEDQERPRSRNNRRNQKSRHIQLQKIEKINKSLYNWLEE